MTYVSLAQAARLLGIDGKTLQRWLAEAQLSVQPHPTDGRQKGLSLEQLHILAQRHQRQLALLSAESSARAETPTPALLALAEHLTVLEAQVVALQQQIADLSRLVLPRRHPRSARRLRRRPAPLPGALVRLSAVPPKRPASRCMSSHGSSGMAWKAMW